MRLEQLCLRRGLKLTEHRRIVVEILEAATDHPCVREIHRRAARDHRIGVATVYRTLNRLAAAGLVTRHVFRDGKARYERAGAAPHHHLIDVGTGQVVEVGDERLTRLVEEAARRLGYRLVDYRMTLFGEATRGAITS
jgi:Fur family transcriptional regulator, ferric uptake regulator